MWQFTNKEKKKCLPFVQLEKKTKNTQKKIKHKKRLFTLQNRKPPSNNFHGAWFIRTHMKGTHGPPFLSTPRLFAFQGRGMKVNSAAAERVEDEEDEEEGVRNLCFAFPQQRKRGGTVAFHVDESVNN